MVQNTVPFFFLYYNYFRIVELFSGFLILMENLNNVNFNKAIKQFILAYCTPELQADNIILGNQNNVVLPETEDYAVFHIIDMQRRGKGEQGLLSPDKNNDYYMQNTNIVRVQIELYCANGNGTTDINAMLRAKSLEVMANSVPGVEHFKQYGMSCLYADAMKASIGVGDSGLLDFRWIVNLTLSYNSQYTVKVDTFSHVDIKLNPIEDVTNE